MLLRRMMEHVRAQNWLAVGLDFLIVVVGVFIGLQVSNWNTLNQQRQLEGEILERLHADFAEIAAWSTTGRTYVEKLHENTALMVQATMEGGLPDDREAQLLAAVNESYDLLIALKTSATYTEILSSGQVRLVRNDELRRALARYQAASDESQTAFLALSQAFMRHVDVIDKYATVGVEPEDLLLGNNIRVIAYDWTALERDPQLAATFRFLHNLRSNEYLFFQRLAEEALAVQAILDEELGHRH